MEHWFVQKAEVYLRPGGGQVRVGIGHGRNGQDPSARTVPSPELYLGSLFVWPTTIISELTAENDGTRLRFIQTDIGEGEDWGNYYTGMDHGWEIHLNNLTSWLETGICPPPGPTKSL